MASADAAGSIEAMNQPLAALAGRARSVALALLRVRDFRLALLAGAVLVFGFEMPAVTMIALLLLGGVVAPA